MQEPCQPDPGAGLCHMRGSNRGITRGSKRLIKRLIKHTWHGKKKSRHVTAAGCPRSGALSALGSVDRGHSLRCGYQLRHHRPCAPDLAHEVMDFRQCLEIIVRIHMEQASGDVAI